VVVAADVKRSERSKFVPAGIGNPIATAPRKSKVFCFFFSKKKFLLTSFQNGQLAQEHP
jgi:hypothetical protein